MLDVVAFVWVASLLFASLQLLCLCIRLFLIVLLTGWDFPCTLSFFNERSSSTKKKKRIVLQTNKKGKFGAVTKTTKKKNEKKKRRSREPIRTTPSRMISLSGVLGMNEKKKKEP